MLSSSLLVGDLQRPCCSRCSEAGLPCTYSAERRKPGPPRGSRRQRLAASPSIGSASTETLFTLSHQGDAFLAPDQSSLANVSNNFFHNTIDDFGLHQQEVQFGDFDLYNSIYDPTVRQNTYPGYSLSREHERALYVDITIPESCTY